MESENKQVTEKECPEEQNQLKLVLIICGVSLVISIGVVLGTVVF